MKKILSLLIVALASVSAFAEETVTYALSEGDTFTSGQTIDVKKGTLTVATITYGESGGADFGAAQADASVDGFTAFTPGNGINGNKEKGTWYTITPVYDGTINVAVVLNADKKFYIEEDDVALTAYNGITVGSKYYGTYEFNVTAGKSYKVYCAGSKLGFYGFKYVLSEYTVAGDNTTLFGTSWDPTNTVNDMVLDETSGLFKWEKADVELTEGTVQFKVTKDHSWDTSYPGSDYVWNIPADGTYFASITFDASASTKDVTATLTKIDQVDLRGEFNSWTETTANILEKDAEAYIWRGTLDLSSTISDQKFKPVINGSNGSTWLTFGVTTIDAPSGWLVSAGDDEDNFLLKNSTTGYKTYTITATWVPNASEGANWTLKIEGKDERAHQTYTLNFVNNPNWNEVYCYAWTGDYKSLGEWPGTMMTEKDGTQEIGGTSYDKYTATYTFYEPAIPTKVIFNNGSSGVGRQTADLTIANNETYSGPVYYVVGNQDVFGDFDVTKSTALMTGNDGVYTIEFTDEILSSDISYKIVEKKYYGSDDVSWYPYNNQSLSIPVKGKYNVTISFDGSKDMNASASVDGSSATKTYEAVTIGATGWATTVTNSPLDFSGLTESFKAYTATVSGTEVTLNPVDDVQAETGLVLKGNEGTFYAPVIASSETAKGDLKHSSIYTFTVNDGGNDYYCYGLGLNTSGDAQFRKISDGVIIPAQKAFLTVSKSASANELTVSFGDGAATGINTLNAERTMMNGEMYNLAGQKVNKSFKGIVITNGRKVMMK